MQQTYLILSVHFTNNSFIYIRLIIISGVKCFWKIDAWGNRVVIKGIGCDLGEWFWLKIHTIWQHWKIDIVKSDSIHHFLENASTKSGTLQFPRFLVVNYGFIPLFTMVLVFPFRLTPLFSVMLLLSAFNIGDWNTCFYLWIILYDELTAIWLVDLPWATQVIQYNLFWYCDVANDKFK